MTTPRNLRNQQTRGKRIAELNTLYVYDTRHKVARLHKRHERGDGYPYTLNGVPEFAAEDEIYIYHRTAEIDGVMKGLTIVTKEPSYKAMQKWFTEQIKAIGEDDKLLEVFKHAGVRPEEMGVRYGASSED